MKRCAWARTPLSIEYHDREWGVPVHDDRVLFEFITLEGAQAGLSWETILRKREAYRAAFANFDPAKVARFTAARRARLMRDPGIVRNRLKIDSTVANAAAYLEVQREFRSFDRFLRGFVEGKGRSGLADALSKELRRRGFRFVGATICYAFMQAVGIVNDHSKNCFRFRVCRDA
jgi:DNA-3-methyladenine glycosylase I